MINFISHFNILDYIIVAVIGLSVIISFFRGLLREAISLVTWFLAFVIALKFSPAVSTLFHNTIHSDTARHVVAIFMLFIFVLILGMLCNKLAHSLVNASGMGGLDKLLGFVFGVLRGFLFVIIVLLMINASPYQNANWMQQSVLAPYFQRYVTLFRNMMPNEMDRISVWFKNTSH